MDHRLYHIDNKCISVPSSYSHKNPQGGFLSHCGSPSQPGFQYQVMVIHDDWIFLGVYPRDLLETRITHHVIDRMWGTLVRSWLINSMNYSYKVLFAYHKSELLKLWKHQLSYRTGARIVYIYIYTHIYILEVPTYGMQHQGFLNWACNFGSENFTGLGRLHI